MVNMIKLVISLPVYVGAYSYLLGFELPRWVYIASIPVTIAGLVLLSEVLIKKVKLPQAAKDYEDRKMNPLFQELLGRQKNCERALNPDFKEEWEWSRDDWKGGFNDRQQ
jgi:hypothetical protein